MSQWKAYRLEIIIIVLFIAALAMAGCSSQPTEPCQTWACEKQKARDVFESQCRRAENKANADLWLAGIGLRYDFKCQEQAKRRYP